MKTAIVTDSNSGLTAKQAEELGIFLLPMPIIIDGVSYLEGIDINHEKLYEAMSSDAEYSTSQPSLGNISELWNKILNSGYDAIIHIPMTSGLSGSCQSASVLAEDFDNKVFVVDNHRISITQAPSAIEAKNLADQGVSPEKIKEYLEKTALSASIYLSVDSLHHLQKGGRLSSTAAVLGTVLNIKPVLTIQGEKIDTFAKVRGTKLCESKLVEALKNDIETRFGDVDKEKLVVGAAGTLTTKESEEHWRSIVQEAFPFTSVEYSPLPCSIACHVGPECLGIAVAVKEY